MTILASKFVAFSKLNGSNNFALIKGAQERVKD